MPEQSISQFLSSVGALTLEEIDREIANAYANPSITRLLEAARIVILERENRVSPFGAHSDRPHVDRPHGDRSHSDRPPVQLT